MYYFDAKEGLIQYVGAPFPAFCGTFCFLCSFPCMAFFLLLNNFPLSSTFQRVSHYLLFIFSETSKRVFQVSGTRPFADFPLIFFFLSFVVFWHLLGMFCLSAINTPPHKQLARYIIIKHCPQITLPSRVFCSSNTCAMRRRFSSSSSGFMSGSRPEKTKTVSVLY